MLQHPIPQNVTTYKFRLVGNWTLKQFALLMVGVGLAILVYFSNLYGPIKWLLMFTAFAFGASLAFLPIQERPLDQWIVAYIKAIYSPTQFIWRKMPEKPAFFNFSPKPDLLPEQTQEMINAAILRKKAGLSSFIQTLPEQQIAAQLNQQESARLDFINELYLKPNLALPKTKLNPKPSIQFDSFSTPAAASVSVSAPKNDSAGILYQASPLPTPSPPPTSPSPQTPISVVVPSQSPVEAAKSTSPEPTPHPLQTPASSHPQTSTVIGAKPLQSDSQAVTDASLPFPSTPTTPNTLVGMVLDINQNLIANAIVEVKDSQGIPVRATKTNKLGQFFSTTPLKNGTYDVVIEKEGFSFDILSLKLEGHILNPLKITAKN
jgi:hypothetical protein